MFLCSGEIHCDERQESDYDLSLYRFQHGESIGIDAGTTGNEARFVNDYRGIKGKPNAVFIDYRADSGELRMGIWALSEDIKKVSSSVLLTSILTVLGARATRFWFLMARAGGKVELLRLFDLSFASCLVSRYWESLLEL